MKITREDLIHIIKEELEALQEEKKLDPERPGMYQGETPAEFSAAVGREKERKASLAKDKKQRDDLRKAKQQATARAMGRLQEQEAQEGEEVVQKAMKIKDNPKVQALYAKLDNNPEVQAALRKVMKELPQEAGLQEKISAPKDYIQTGPTDHYPEDDPSYEKGFETGKLAASPNRVDATGNLGIPGAAMATAWAAGGGLTKGAGAALVTALIPALGLTGATLATGGIAIAAPLALGYLLDVMADPRHKIKEK